MNNRGLGDAFAGKVRDDLLRRGYEVEPEYAVQVGLSSTHKKAHRFDLGSPTLLVECKAYAWTIGGNSPSGKLATLNEAVLLLHSAPVGYRKMLFVSRTAVRGVRVSETLGQYYVRTYRHMIPDDVEIWELDSDTGTVHELTK